MTHDRHATPKRGAVAAWLFLLRPVLLKRWPDPAVVAASVLLLWVIERVEGGDVVGVAAPR
jgi:hypothetical protein